MNAVNMATQMYVTNAKTGQVVAKSSPDVSFSKILSQTASQPGLSDEQSADGDNATEKTLTQVISMLAGGASDNELADALKGLSSEDTDSILAIVEQLINAISGEITSDNSNKTANDNASELLKKLTEDDTSTNVQQAILQLVMSVLPSMAKDNTNDDTEIKAQTIPTVTTMLPATDTAVQTATASAVPSDNVKADLTQMLETFKSALEIHSNQAEPQKLVVVKNDFAEQMPEKSQTEDVRANVPKTQIKPVEQNDEFRELMAFSQQSAQVTATQPVETEKAIPVTKQVTAGIEQMLQSTPLDSSKELTIMLKPAELGEITVKLIKTDDVMTISIAAQNSATQKLLTDKMPQLLSTLQEINPEVKDVNIVNPAQNASSFLSNFNTSHSGADARSSYQQSHTAFTAESSKESGETEQKQFIREGRLWQSA